MKKNLYFAYYSVTNAMSNYGFFSESATICFVDLPVFCYLLESHSAHKQIFFILFQFLSTCLFTELVFTPHVWLIHSFFYVRVDYIQSHSFHLPLDKLAERAKIALCQICDVSVCYWLKSLIHIHQNQRIFSKPRCLSKVKTCRCCS